MNPCVYKLLLVEDDPKQLEVMKLIFDSDDHFDLVGVARNYQESIRLLNGSRVDLAVVDIDLKDDKNGIDVIAYAVGHQPDIRILVNTVCEDSDTLFKAFKAGAEGYVLKGLTPVKLFEYLQRLTEGEVPMSPKIARRMLAYFRGEKTRDNLLTPQELNVLELADTGFTYRQIGDKLFISRHTVHSHFKNIYAKLQVNGRRAAIAKAKKMSIL